MLDLVEQLARQIPCYRMEFDRSGKILTPLEELVHKPDIVRSNPA